MKHQGEEHYIYVAGPIYGSGHVDTNVKAALTIAEIMSSEGDYENHAVIPFVPHLYMFWHFRSDQPREKWLRFDKAWLRKCDGMVRIAGESPGSLKEEGWAEEWGIPVLHLPSVEFIQGLASNGSGYWHEDIGVKIRAWVETLPK